MNNTSQSLSYNSAVCIADSLQQVKQILEDLKTEGCGMDEVSVLVPANEAATRVEPSGTLKRRRRTLERPSTLTSVGSALGMVMGLGAYAIPKVGVFIAGGPIAAVVGGAACGIAGGLIALGFPEFVARRYEKKVREGNILISLHVPSFTEITKAEAVIKRSGAGDVTVMW